MGIEIIKEPTRKDRAYILQHRLTTRYAGRHPNTGRSQPVMKQENATIFDGGEKLDLFLEHHPTWKPICVGGIEQLAKFRVLKAATAGEKWKKHRGRVDAMIQKAKQELENS